MKELGIAVMIVAGIALVASLAFHVVDPSRPIPERSGPVPLAPASPAVATAAAPSATTAPALTGVALGEATATSAGCAACHSVDGTRIVGPTWKGLAGSQVTLADGSTRVADDAYLRESILNPAAQIVDGYTDDMPASFGAALSTDQIDALIAYIKTLQ